MATLQPPDSHHLLAATGWLELGNATEARQELNRIRSRCHNHPAVLELEWGLCAHEKDWTTALELARRLVKLQPKDPSGWIHQSYSLHELGRTQEARDDLLGVADQFADIGTIAYNLACYACQLGHRDEARSWLKRAIRLEGEARIKQLADQDADLEPLRDELTGL